MKLRLPLAAARAYKSPAQRIGVLTEAWVAERIFCPHCGSQLKPFPANRPVADFSCTKCNQEYELKSKNGAIGKKVVNGAYLTMLQRLRASNNPHFFFLSYESPELRVRDFVAVPKYFFVPAIIEKRVPLAPTARRAGWVGCNILLASITALGRVAYISNGVVRSKEQVLQDWHRTEFVGRTSNLDARGWLLDVLTCVEKIGRPEFTLDQVYAFEGWLKSRHPNNYHIRDKIRQQLQFLRDRGIIDFLARGRYRMKLVPS